MTHPAHCTTHTTSADNKPETRPTVFHVDLVCISAIKQHKQWPSRLPAATGGTIVSMAQPPPLPLGYPPPGYPPLPPPGYPSLPPLVLHFSLGLLWTAHLLVMTTAQIASLVMDLPSVVLYHMYDTDSFLGSWY